MDSRAQALYSEQRCLFLGLAYCAGIVIRIFGIEPSHRSRIAGGWAGSVLLSLGIARLAAAVPQTYTVQDLTGWSAEQLATLPYFDRWAPPVPGQPAEFERVARNGRGLLAGNLGEDGVFVHDGLTTHIEPWGEHHWGYWSCDAHDCHYFWGTVRYSPVSDANVFGRIVGRATVDSPFSEHSTDARSHAYLFNPDTGLKTDLTPGARYASAAGISDGGVIVGSYSTADSYHAFRREPDGTMRDYTVPGATVTPSVINNLGWVAGTHITYSVNNRAIVAWVAPGGMEMLPLPLPHQGSPDAAGLLDMNDHGLIVGNTWKQKSRWETGPARWYPAGGAWRTDNLDEIAEGGDLIIDAAVAVNDAGYIIAKGHLDGTDNLATRLFLLTPDRFPGPTAVALPPANLTATSATLQGKVNACTADTTVVFELGPAADAVPLAAPAPATVTGTTPAVVTVDVADLQPHTTYPFRVRAGNANGDTTSPDGTFTTPYDYATWATERFGADAGNPALAGPEADSDGDGRNNFAEYALGGDPRSADATGWSTSVEGGVFNLSFTRPLDRAGLTVTVEAATSVNGPWGSGPGFTERSRADVSGNWETVEYRCLLPADGPARFLRIRVSHTP